MIERRKKEAVSYLQPLGRRHQRNRVHVGKLRPCRHLAGLEPAADPSDHAVQRLHSLLHVRFRGLAQLCALQRRLVDELVPAIADPVAVDGRLRAVESRIGGAGAAVALLVRLAEGVELTGKDDWILRPENGSFLSASLCMSRACLGKTTKLVLI